VSDVDLTQSIEPRSDQVNADDLIGGPITYTVREVIQGKAEQPFDFLLVETDRAYRPSKTMRRVIVNAWGAEASNYAGRRLTLYREPTIKFGGQTVGARSSPSSPWPTRRPPNASPACAPSSAQPTRHARPPSSRKSRRCRGRPHERY
jgi:hypothetical protein